MSARDAGLLPPGTLPAGVGVAILAAASYGFLALAGHTLTQADMADLSVLWSVVLTLGVGLFFPIEQEMTRTAAARRAAGAGSGPIWRRGSALAGVVFGGAALALLATAPALAHRLYANDVALVAATVAALLGLAVAAPVRGLVAGVARFDLYGTQLGLDGALRLALAAALAAVGAGSAVLFGAAMAIAPILASLVLLPAIRRSAAPGPAARELGRGLAPLTVSVLLSQLVLNSAVIGARLIAPQWTALTAALLAALILIRVPLFAFAAVQATLLSGVASALAGNDLRAYRRLLRRALAVVTGLVVAGAVPAVAVGPWLIQVLFAAPAVLGRADFAVLAVGTWAYLVALVLGQGAIARGHHRAQMLAWICGTATLILVTVAPGDVALRVELAYAAGNIVVAGGLAAVLVTRGSSLRRRVPAAVPARTA